MAKKKELTYEQRLQRVAALNVLQVPDVAVMLDLSEDRLRHLMSERKIPYYVNVNGRVNFNKQELEKWTLGYRVATAAELEQEARMRM